MAAPPERPGPLPALLRPLGPALARVYTRAIAARNARFDRGRGVVRFDRPVISVGNLSVGGTGKTPMVREIVRVLRDAGHTPCIAMRGYGSDARTESDEAGEYRRAFADVPIVAQPDRTHGLITLFAREHDEQAAPGEGGGNAASPRRTDCIVLDDGFQHRQIGRELDIVLIDATRDPFADRPIPAGWLREPVASLLRADVIVLTHAERVEASMVRAIDAAVEHLRGRGLDAICRHAWAGLTLTHESGSLHARGPDAQGPDEPSPADPHASVPVSWLAGRRVAVACAIGNPEAFLSQARAAVGGALAGELVLRDHDPFAPATVERLVGMARSSAAGAIIVTEKDWSKLAPRRIAWPCPIVRPRLELAFDRGGEALFSRVIDAVRAGVPEDQVSPPMGPSEASAMVGR